MVQTVNLGRRALGLSFGLIALALATVVAAIVGTVMGLPFLGLPRGRREKYSHYATVVFSWAVVRLVLWHRPYMHEGGWRPAGQPALIVCNHRSWLDVLLLAWLGRASGLSKQLVLYLPFIGFYAWLGGAVFFQRKSPESREKARQEVLAQLKSGNRIFIFPEGTRTRTGELRDKVHLSLIKDCYTHGIDVVPAGVMGTERAIPTLFPAAFPGQSSQFRFADALSPRDFSSADSFAIAVWDMVATMVRDMSEGLS